MPDAASEADSLERYIALIEAMRNPPRLTRGLELDAAQAGIVERVAGEVSERGYAVVDDFLGPERLAELREELAPIFALTGNRVVREGRGWPGVQTVHIPNLFAKTRALDDLAIDALLLHIVEHILGRQFQMSVAVAMCPGPGADRQGLHQDDSHYPLPRPHMPLVANTLISLDPFTPENGATLVVPGSHRWAQQLDPDAKTVAVTLPPGALLVWDGALWHAGGANTTADQHRRSINLNFNASWLRQQENQYLGVPREVIRRMPERLQRVLGYNRVNHLCGGVEYQDPLDYFSKVI